MPKLFPNKPSSFWQEENLHYEGHKNLKLYAYALSSKICVKRPLSKRPKIGFQDQSSLNVGRSIAKCSKGSILQYFWPSINYHLSLRSLFCLFLSGHFTQFLLLYFDDILLDPAFCSSSSLLLSLSTALFLNIWPTCARSLRLLLNVSLSLGVRAW